ncbi:hypothetical protein BCR35DRAFT_354311 [Leucosporidium creatinivorum]|uniref:BTB domain-containing protein n=1 Tax=Leucosporidium creatinivorum TaxID=106004 RepID=A0A1Y2EME8_9BASI|nr:hypothetical protein BCR35DRAFT_354311 [Leucosporidium creatinivorum]
MSRTADEAGLDKDGEQSAPAPKLTLSSTYNASDADVELRSKDGVRFLVDRVHRANLLASSKMLAGMFETVPAPEVKVPIIHLAEDSAVLQQMLAYFYPKRLPRLKLGDMDEDVALIAAFDKYEVWRGIEAYSSAFYFKYGAHFFDRPVRYWPTLGNSFCAYAFARSFGIDDLHAGSKLALIESAEGTEDLEETLSSIYIGSLGAAVDVSSVALRLLAYIHNSRQTFAEGRIHFSSRLRGMITPKIGHVRSFGTRVRVSSRHQAWQRSSTKNTALC